MILPGSGAGICNLRPFHAVPFPGIREIGGGAAAAEKHDALSLAVACQCEPTAGGWADVGCLRPQLSIPLPGIAHPSGTGQAAKQDRAPAIRIKCHSKT